MVPPCSQLLFPSSHVFTYGRDDAESTQDPEDIRHLRPARAHGYMSKTHCLPFFLKAEKGLRARLKTTWHLSPREAGKGRGLEKVGLLETLGQCLATAGLLLARDKAFVGTCGFSHLGKIASLYNLPFIFFI